jgi:sugar phosphate isomerase/epimerase
MTRQEAAASVASPSVRKAVAWLFGGFALFGFLRRRRGQSSQADPRADELRRKLDESRVEPAVAPAEPPPEDPESRRRAVHEAGRDAVDRMRRG